MDRQSSTKKSGLGQVFSWLGRGIFTTKSEPQMATASSAGSKNMDPAASALQLSTFTKVQSIPRPEKYPDFPVTVRLAAPGTDKPVRAPVDIIVAMDDSMSSNTNVPMEELEKAAVELLIKKLGADDRLAILPFSHQIELDAAAKEMAQLLNTTYIRKKKIGGLVKDRKFTRGGTVLVKPMSEAQKILKQREDASRAALIILLSDGQDKTVLEEKVWSRESELKDPKFPVHTFGFTDHTRETLSFIADKTKGKYFHDDIASEADLEKFTAGFEALLSEATSQPFSAVSASASLASVHPGISIARIDPGEKKASISADARSGDVDIGVIKAGETPEFTVYLDVPEGDADVMEVLAVSGAYTQGWDGKHVNLGRSVVSLDRPAPTPQQPEPALGQDPCKALDQIEERIKYWCKVKKDLSAMDEKLEEGVETKCHCDSTAAIKEAALEALNRAMHLDIYTAVVQALTMRRCGGGGGKPAADETVKT